MKKIFAIFLSAMLCLSAAGCSKKAAPRTVEPVQSEPPELISSPEPFYPDESISEEESEIIVITSEPETEIAPSKPVSDASIREQSSPQSKSAPAPAQSSGSSVRQSEASELLKSVAPEIKLDSEKIELELLRLINELRGQVGVEALGIQENMRFAARIRSLEALASFSHTRLDGTPYNTAFSEAGFDYAGKWHGENLSSLRFTEGILDEKAIALEMFNGLKNSPGHYQNMVGANFAQAGIGTSVSYNNGMVDIASAQLFSSL